MARRFARRRKPSVQWMPTYGVIAGDPELPRAIGVETEIELSGDGAVRWDVTTLTFDDTKSQAADGDYSLQDVVTGNSWRLRRIVGKLFASWVNNAAEIDKRAPLIDYAAGFIVGKTDDEGLPTADFDEVNPMVQEGADDPWIWRRRWMLSTIGNKPTAVIYNGSGSVPYYSNDVALLNAYPASTAEYHSVADGPHIDQKTARVIDRQERLLFVQAARLVGNHVLYAEPGALKSFLDYRLLGSLVRTAPGNRRNASR